jgi:hypothetical protein
MGAGKDYGTVAQGKYADIIAVLTSGQGRARVIAFV